MIRIVVLILLTGIAGYFLWSSTGRDPEPVDVQLMLDSTIVINTDAGKGNVIGISPYMLPEDYASEIHFQRKLDGYLKICKEKGWISPKTVVIFPEYIGSWLVIAGEKNDVINATSIEKAMSTFVVSNYFSYIQSWFMSPDSARDKVRHSIFATKGNKMVRIYTRVFSQLAARYGITIIAGSILLQNPVVSNDRKRIRLSNGSLENVTAVFNPDGTLQKALTKKAYPTADEQPFVMKSKPPVSPVYTLPIGKTAIMICADAWYPESYQALAGQDLSFIAVPTYTPGDGSMQNKWTGYSGYPLPADVPDTSIGRISLQDAWIRYALPARIQTTSATHGMIVSLRGKLWDLGTDGSWMVSNNGKLSAAAPSENASMVCLWMN